MLNALTSTFVSPLQGEGRGFDSLSAHPRKTGLLGAWRSRPSGLRTPTSFRGAIPRVAIR